jgi:dephospho-CoA kinase
MHSSPKIPLIGIAGGIASGKSLVTEHLKQLGAAVVSADAAAHEVLEQDEVKQLARERWHDAIFTADGRIDRTALAQIVFAPPPDGPREREYLEQITHPRIGAIIRREVQNQIDRGAAAAIVLDVPLLFEAGWNEICDTVLFVDAPRELREARAQGRGWTAEEFARRENAQQTPAAKRQQADVVIDNSTTPAAAQEQVERFWRTLVGRAAP